MFGDFKTLKISELEAKILKFWEDNKIFQKSVSKKAPKGDYVFYDGPPFATGLPHYGHVLSGVIKDVIPRYQTMKGKRVERIWGWDCHGLPVENLIEQELGLKTKKDIEKYGIRKFNEAARESVLEYADDWKKIIARIGRWVDMENAYRTMDPEYMESIWWVFKNLYDKKLIYEGYKSMHICPRCETTLSNFEVALGYREIRDSSIIAKFLISNFQFPNTYMLVWTTTPWTLPGNVALAVNPDAVYVVASSKKQAKVSSIQYQVSSERENYILAKERLAELGGEYEILKEFKGKELTGLKYEPLFDYYQKTRIGADDISVNPRGNQRESALWKNGWKIYGADFVKTDEGTGIVHIAPAFGENDMNLGKKHNLPFIQHVGMDGRFKKEVKDFAGMPVKPKDPSAGSGHGHQSTDQKIVDWLAENNKIFKSETVVHSYPHCWRCDTPLLNYAASSWFVNVAKIKKGKDGLLDNNKKINWIPPHIKEGRFGRGLADAPDWAISRSRFWGAPLPVWRCQTGKFEILNPKSEIPISSRILDGRAIGTNPKSKILNSKSCQQFKVIGSIDELKESTKKSGNKYFLMRHGFALHNLKDILNSNLNNSKKYPLTPDGRECAASSVKKLKKLLANEKIDLIFSSDLLRGRETAELAAEMMGLPKKKIIFDKRLRDIDFGDFEGKPSRYYREYAAPVEKFYQAPPQGENLINVKNRAADFIYEIDKRYKNKNILVVSHETIIWLMMAAAMGADPTKSVEIKKEKEKKNKSGDYLSPGELIILDFTPLPHNSNFELDLHLPYIDELNIVCECGGKLKRVNYVFDCWFESGAMPFAQAHFPFAFAQNQKSPPRADPPRAEKTKDQKPETLLNKMGFPAEFIAEGLDQTRGWFYTLLVLSTALFKKSAFKNVIVNGIILAEDGQKMSKRLKNYPDPMAIVGKYGADALRFYLLSSPVVRAEDLNFSEKGVDEVYKKVILRLINVVNFYNLYTDQHGQRTDSHGNNFRRSVFSPYKSVNVLDKWITARLNQLLRDVTAAMDSYELDKATRPITDFIDDLSTWYIRRSRERFKFIEADKRGLGRGSTQIRQDSELAINTTRFVLMELAKIMAPFTPFLAEMIYQQLTTHNLQLKTGESVHLAEWPKPQLRIKNKELRIIKDMKEARRLASLGLEARAKAGIKVRQPLAGLSIKCQVSSIKGNKELLKILADEVNVKEIIFDPKIENEVELDTNITSELKEGGVLREFARLTQGLRQEAGYTRRDKIYLWLEIPKNLEDILSRHIQEFKMRVGAKNIEFRRSPKFDAEIETQVDGQKIWAGTRKV